VNAHQFGGKSLRDSVSWNGEINSYEKPAWEILEPFCDRIWNNCGLERSALQKAELANRFMPRK
jgi:hypothetical protein